MTTMVEETEERRYKIGEVCRRADVQPYVLRYWETEFPALTPGKTGGGQRLYTEDEVRVILRIKELLYAEGFTIAGAKKRLDAELKVGGVGLPDETPRTDTQAPKLGADARKIIRETKKELRALLEFLE